MRIVAVDDERLALEILKESISEACPDSELFGFRNPAEVVEFVKENPCEIAFLDIEMRGMSGVELAQKLKEIQPDINIIFVTGYSEHMAEAFSLHASGYVLKPASREKIEEELANLRNPVTEKPSHIRVQTFGHFEVFVDGKPVLFSRAKAKELLALLVDNKGAGLTTPEIATALWEDKAYTRSVKNQVQNTVKYLYDALKACGIEEILIKKWNNLAVDTAKVDCDYYRFLEGDAAAIRSFEGEYMVEYSWAEFTTGFLSNEK